MSNEPEHADELPGGSNSQSNAADGSIASELNMILPGDSPLDGMTVEKTGPVQYTVLSSRNGSATVHRVNTADPSCTCEDFSYNVNGDGNRQVCAHVAKVLIGGERHPDPNELALSQLYQLLDTVRDVQEDLRDEAEILRDHATSAGVERRSQEAENNVETNESSSTGIDPDAKAEALTDAYAGVGIEIETSIDVDSDSGQERIWVETAEQISEGKFSAFLQEPDRLRYDPDEKDGYVNNWVKPAEVDELIEEVF